VLAHPSDPSRPRESDSVANDARMELAEIAEIAEIVADAKVVVAEASGAVK